MATLTVTDVMNRYSVTQATVLGWIANGELRAMNVGTVPGKKKPRWRISQSALDAFEAARTSSAPVSPTRRKRQSSDIVEFIR